jgi:putative hemolysin
LISYFSTILIGNNIVNIASASIATVIFTFYYGDAGVTISTLVTTVLVLIFGEITPKSLAKEKPELVAMYTTPILQVLNLLFRPLTFLFSLWKKLLSLVFNFEDKQSITQEELITLVDEAQNEGGINSHEGELIRSAIEFNDLDVAEILTPRVKIVAVNQEASTDEISSIFISHGFSRLPVYNKTIDNIIGVIHEKDFYAMMYHENKDLRAIIKSIVWITPQMKISELLRLLQQAKSHIAAVVDEYGGTLGIVTLEDILEELVGEIWDEHDEVVDHFVEINENQFHVHCTANLDEFFKRFELKSRSDNYNAITVGGWIVNICGKIPPVGYTFDFESLIITVTKADARKSH